MLKKYILKMKNVKNRQYQVNSEYGTFDRFVIILDKLARFFEITHGRLHTFSRNFWSIFRCVRTDFFKFRENVLLLL